MSMLSVLLPIILIEFILLLIALIDLVRRDRAEVVFERKWPWVLIIVLVSGIGSIIYLAIGRKH
jgi:hypothetical protein